MDNELTVTPPPQVAPPTAPVPGKPTTRNPILIVVGVAVVVVIAILLWVFVFAGPSQADFKQAKDTTQEASNLYDDIDSDLKRYVNSSSSFNDDVEATVSSYKDRVDELKGMKAFRDKEAKKLYDEFVAKNEKFIAFVDGFVQSKSAFRDATENCSASKVSGITSGGYDTISDRYNAAIGPCIESLGEIAKSDSDVLAKYGKKLEGLYKEQQQLFADLQKAYIARDSTALSSAASSISRQSSEFTSSANDLTDAIKDIDASKEINALGRYLTDKANGK